MASTACLEDRYEESVMSAPQSPATTPAAGRKAQGEGALPLPPQIGVYHQTHDVVYYQ